MSPQEHPWPITKWSWIRSLDPIQRLPSAHGLGRLDEAEQMLRYCQEVFETVGDTAGLALVYGARADREGWRGHFQDALTLTRTALRLNYVSPEPHPIAASHHNLADYLFRTTGKSADQRAHRLAARVLRHFTGDTHALSLTLRVLADELRSDTDAPEVPTTLPEIIRLVDAGDGVHFGDLVTTLCPDPDTADRALTDLLATAATRPDQPADENTVERLLTDWDPIITVVATGHTPTKIADSSTNSTTPPIGPLSSPRP